MSGRRPDDDRSDPTPVVVAEYGTYSRAQAALEELTAEGLPHASVSLVWSRLRQIEPATPVRATASAVVEGALAGASVGGLTAILVSLFVELQDGMTVVAVVTWWTLAFAALGALARAVAPLIGRDERLSRGAELAAESYQLWVDEALASRATAILGADRGQPPSEARPAGRPVPGTEGAPPAPPIHTTAATLLGPPTSQQLPPQPGRAPVDPRPGAP